MSNFDGLQEGDFILYTAPESGRSSCGKIANIIEDEIVISWFWSSNKGSFLIRDDRYISWQFNNWKSYVKKLTEQEALLYKLKM